MHFKSVVIGCMNVMDVSGAQLGVSVCLCWGGVSGCGDIEELFQNVCFKSIGLTFFCGGLKFHDRP